MHNFFDEKQQQNSKKIKYKWYEIFNGTRYKPVQIKQIWEIENVFSIVTLNHWVKCLEKVRISSFLCTNTFSFTSCCLSVTNFDTFVKEIALVRRSVRTATIVCLEITEMLVIDKEDFYQLGIDKCAKEEMLFRHKFMK